LSARDLTQLPNAVDLLVIGGGITGAGIALEAARRGVAVLLVEARDYAWGTSSRSSKLIHGGLRYLRQGQFAVTRESARERQLLLQQAPGLVEPQRFLMAHWQGRAPSRSAMRLGLLLYDALAGVRTRTFHDPAETRLLAPHLAESDLVGSSAYMDGKTDDARLVLRVLQEARAYGAATANYVTATELLHDQHGVCGARLAASEAGGEGTPQGHSTARDYAPNVGAAANANAPTLAAADSTATTANASADAAATAPSKTTATGPAGPAAARNYVKLEVRAACVINATGVWADALRPPLDATTHAQAPKLRPLRGSHILLPPWRLPLGHAVSLLHPRDGRPVFAFPWEGVALVGTTDLDHTAPLAQEPSITAAEVEYLLDAVRFACPRLTVHAADIISTYAGVRPVISHGAADPSKEARDYAIVEERRLVSVLGGKLTTFRAIALDALRHAAARLPARAREPMHRAGDELFAPQAARGKLAALPAPLRDRLLGRYGRCADDVLACAQDDDLERVAGTPTLWAELRWAARAESVLHLDDLLLRRTRIGLLCRAGAREWLPQVQRIVQTELDWSDTRWQAECDRYLSIIERCYSVPPQCL
jgi:glycerol-3-phosphate dehydrogenase